MILRTTPMEHLNPSICFLLQVNIGPVDLGTCLPIYFHFTKYLLATFKAQATVQSVVLRIKKTRISFR